MGKARYLLPSLHSMKCARELFAPESVNEKVVGKKEKQHDINSILRSTASSVMPPLPIVARTLLPQH